MKDWHVGVIVVAVIAVVVAFLALQPSTWNIMGRADISDVMFIWEIEFVNASADCVALGGEWHSEYDWWGCEGVGPGSLACSGEVADILEQMCEGMGAVWTCNMRNAYCRYE